MNRMPALQDEHQPVEPPFWPFFDMNVQDLKEINIVSSFASESIR